MYIRLSSDTCRLRMDTLTISFRLGPKSPVLTRQYQSKKLIYQKQVRPVIQFCFLQLPFGCNKTTPLFQACTQDFYTMLRRLETLF